MNTSKHVIFMSFRQSRFFQGVSNEKIMRLIELSDLKAYQKDDTILAQGQENESVYFLLSGSVSVFMDKEFIYNLCRKGDIFGEMSVINNEASSATIKAYEDLQVITISTRMLRDIHDDKDHELHAIVYEWFAKILSDKLHKTSLKAKLHEQLSRRLRGELERAKKTQDLIFSSVLRTIDNFPVVVKSVFADILGGDLYATFLLDNERYGILLGDVSGHGADASLLSVMTINLFQNFPPKSSSSKEVVSAINNLALYCMPDDKFVTLFYAIYDPASNNLTYTTGGHHQALILREQEIIELPITQGLPIGIFRSEEMEYSENHFELIKGDKLVVFTDAIFENISPGEEGFKKLLSFLRQNITEPPEKLVNLVYDFGASFTKGVYGDDFTLMIFEQK